MLRNCIQEGHHLLLNVLMDFAGELGSEDRGAEIGVAGRKEDRGSGKRRGKKLMGGIAYG
jgi:hypothetical protein